MFYEIILDIGETPNKCTISPLAGRLDFRLLHVKGAKHLGPLQAPLLLHHQGECILSLKKSEDSISGLACIDCTWKRLDPLLNRLEGPIPKLAKIPEGFETAYPRQNRWNRDPQGGLATIEAIFTASALLGNWDPSLFSEYYFGARYLELNRRRFLELGVTEASNPELMPIWNPRPKTSKQRRLDRGQAIRNPDDL